MSLEVQMGSLLKGGYCGVPDLWLDTMREPEDDRDSEWALGRAVFLKKNQFIYHFNLFGQSTV